MAVLMLRDPHPHDRSRGWIYPNLTDPNAPCHQRVPPLTWITTRDNDPAVEDLESNTPVWRTEQARPTVRAAFRTLSRKNARNATPGAPSTMQPAD
jgi:hypothetical protein